MLRLILSAQEKITLLFVGDLMQHDAQIKAARTPQGYDYSDCFKHLKEAISQADLAIGNLEVTLAGKPYRGYPSFSAPDEYLQAIKEAGFDILLTANNHCLDRRKKGLERTILLLDSLGISHAGTYRTPEERSERYPLLVEVKGLRIAFLNYTYDTNGLEPSAPNVVNYIHKEEIRQDILKARRMHPDTVFLIGQPVLFGLDLAVRILIAGSAGKVGTEHTGLQLHLIPEITGEISRNVIVADLRRPCRVRLPVDQQHILLFLPVELHQHQPLI